MASLISRKQSGISTTKSSAEFALVQSLEAQVEGRLPEELAGAWRALCGLMLVSTALAIRKRALWSNAEAQNKGAARRWLNGGGAIGFRECCECLDLRAERAVHAINDLAEQTASGAIKRVRRGG
jgi:hypothetical protein